MDINLQIVYLCNNYTICNNNYFTPESNCSLKKKKEKKVEPSLLIHSVSVQTIYMYVSQPT